MQNTTERQPASAAAELRGMRAALAWYLPAAVVFLSSASIMTVELVASRLIAQYVGASLYTWTSVIGIVLAGIALGNYIGGRVADAFVPARALTAALIIASAGCVAILPLHRIVGDWEALWNLSWPMRIALHVGFTFLAPATLLGLISPLCAKMALDVGRAQGRTVGYIYAWGAIGSIVGTFATGYYLIAAIGTSTTIWIVAGVLALLAGLVTARSWIGYTWIVVLAFLIAVAVVPLPQAVAVGTALRLRPAYDPLLLYEDDSQYSHIAVLRGVTDRERAMVLDALIHSRMLVDYPDEPQYGYERIYATLTELNRPKDRPLHGLMIGGGGYTYPQHMANTYPDSQVEVVEIDPRVTKAAKAAFELPLRPRMKIHHLDARNFVDGYDRRLKAGEGAERFDLIFADAVNDVNVPFHLTTREFLTQVRDLLREDDGLFLMTIIDRFDEARFLGAMYNTFVDVFGQGRVQVFCDGPSGPDRTGKEQETYVLVGMRNTLNAGVDENGTATNGLYSRLSPDDIEHVRARSGGLVLTDDYAPVENLLAGVVRKKSVAYPLLRARGSRAYMDYRNAMSNRESDVAARELAKAVDYFTRALAIKEDSPEAKANLALVLAQTNEMEATYKAVRLFREALQGDPPQPEWHYDFGVLLARLGQTAEAARHFRETIRLEPTHVFALVNLGGTLLRLQRPAEAVEPLRRAIALVPQHADAHINLGTALYELGQYDEAIQELGAVYAALHDRVNVYRPLGDSLAKTGQYAQAVKILRAGVQANAQDPLTTDRLAWLLATCPDASIREPGEAVRLAETANTATGRTNPAMLDTLAAAQAANGQFDAAVATINDALRLAITQPGGEAFAKEAEKRLDLYKARQAYVAPPVTTAPTAAQP